MLTKVETNEIKKLCRIIIQNNNDSTMRKTKTLKFIKFKKKFIEHFANRKNSTLNKYSSYYDNYINELETGIKLEKELNNLIYDFYCKISELYL